MNSTEERGRKKVEVERRAGDIQRGTQHGAVCCTWFVFSSVNWITGTCEQ